MAIPAEVRNFIAKYIDSAELLDVLMLLHREPGGEWSPTTVSSRVFSVPQAAQRRLEELTARGLAANDPNHPDRYVLSIDDADTQRAVDALRGLYDKSRADVIGVVFSTKSDPIQSFSNAFKLRGDS